MSASIDEELWYGSSTNQDAEDRAAASLAGRVGRVLGAKPFPATALKLARLTRDPRSSMDELLAVLESDPGLSARLLRLVNSAGFALRTACTSVRHAAVLVGNARLNQVATTAAIMDMYASSAKHATRILEHAGVVGALCRYLAFYLALPSDELFTCGFLHDIGKLMLLDTDGADYEALLDEAGDDADRVHLLERERFGFDHALLAGHVLAKWNIPQPVPQVVSWHHNAAHAFSVSSQLGQLVSAVRLADGMSYAFRAGKPEIWIEQLAKTDAAQYLGVSEPQIAAMWDEMAALALRAAAASRGGTGVPETFSMRPSTTSLRVVRGSLSAPARRQASMAPVVEVSPAESENARALQALFNEGRSSLPAQSLAVSERTRTTSLRASDTPNTATQTSKRPGMSVPPALSAPPVSLPRVEPPQVIPTTGTNAARAEPYLGERATDVATPIPPSLPPPSSGSWVAGQSRVPEPPAPLPSISPPPSPRQLHNHSIKPTRLQPAAPEDIRPEMAAISPKQFPCIVCTGPTYAATCNACGAYVCPKHQLGDDAWCQLCVQDYAEFRLERLPQWVILGLGCSYGLLISVAAFSGRGDATARWASAIALGAMLSLLVGLGRYALRKSRFLRSRPSRAEPEEALHFSPLADNGVSSQVQNHSIELAISEAMPPTLPGVVHAEDQGVVHAREQASVHPRDEGVAHASVQQSSPQLERIVPHVDAGILHLQSLLGNNAAGTELDAQIAQESARQGAAAAEGAQQANDALTASIAQARAANDTEPRSERRPALTSVPPASPAAMPMSPSAMPVSPSAMPRAIEALLHDPPPPHSQRPVTLEASRAAAPNREPPPKAEPSSATPQGDSKVAAVHQPPAPAVRAARTLGRARAGTRRSFWKPR